MLLTRSVAQRDVRIAELTDSADAAIRERNAAIAQHNAAVIERNTAVAERNTAVSKRSKAVIECDTAKKTIKQRDVRIQELTASANTAVAERNTATAERNTAVAERNVAVSKLDAAHKSIKQRDKRIQELTSSSTAESTAAACTIEDSTPIRDVISKLNSTVTEQAEALTGLNKTVTALTSSNDAKWLEYSKFLGVLAAAVVVLLTPESAFPRW